MSRWQCEPQKPCQRHLHSHNIALVPASELAAFDRLQECARALPAGTTLVVVPADNTTLQVVGQRIDLTLWQRAAKVPPLRPLRGCLRRG
jgi:hypothetical protein